MNEILELAPVEKDIDSLLRKSGFYLQTYRGIEALNVLTKAHRMMEGQDQGGGNGGSTASGNDNENQSGGNTASGNDNVNDNENLMEKYKGSSSI